MDRAAWAAWGLRSSLCNAREDCASELIGPQLVDNRLHVPDSLTATFAYLLRACALQQDVSFNTRFYRLSGTSVQLRNNILASHRDPITTDSQK